MLVLTAGQTKHQITCGAVWGWFGGLISFLTVMKEESTEKILLEKQQLVVGLAITLSEGLVHFFVHKKYLLACKKKTYL